MFADQQANSAPVQYYYRRPAEKSNKSDLVVTVSLTVLNEFLETSISVRCCCTRNQVAVLMFFYYRDHMYIKLMKTTCWFSVLTAEHHSIN